MELSPIELVLGLLVVAVALGYVARRIGVAYPILLLLGGLVLGYLPGLPSIELDRRSLPSSENTTLSTGPVCFSASSTIVRTSPPPSTAPRSKRPPASP